MRCLLAISLGVAVLVTACAAPQQSVRIPAREAPRPMEIPGPAGLTGSHELTTTGDQADELEFHFITVGSSSATRIRITTTKSRAF